MHPASRIAIASGSPWNACFCQAIGSASSCAAGVAVANTNEETLKASGDDRFVPLIVAHRSAEKTAQQAQSLIECIAERHDIPIVDNSSFDRSVLFVIRHVTDTLRQRGDFDVRDLL